MTKNTQVIACVIACAMVAGAQAVETQAMIDRKAKLLNVSETLLKENKLHKEDFDKASETWIEGVVKPLLLHGMGVDSKWEEADRLFQVGLGQRENYETCRVIEDYVIPYSVLPIANAVMEGLFEPLAEFPTYDIDQGETGVFDMNKPMAKDGKPQYVPADQIGKIKDDGKIRIALVGDWGSGTPESMVMTEYLKELNQTEEIHFSFHLGDVYYAGRDYEVDNIMLNKGSCPDGNGTLAEWFRGSRGTFAMNGNHEMYSRGYGYFDNLIKAYDQKTSYGLFQSEYWNFFLLDSAYNCLPRVDDFLGLLEFALAPSGDPKAPLPKPIQDWMSDPRLNLVSPENQQSIMVAQHMQLVQPFEDSLGFGTDANQTISKFMESGVGSTTRYLQSLMKQKGFKDGYSMVGMWGHDHKSSSMISEVWKSDESEVDVTILGQLMGQGGFIVESPGEEPVYPGGFGMQWYDNSVYKTIDAPFVGPTDIGFNGFNIITIDGPKMKLEYFRSDPSKKEKVQLMAFRNFESNGKNMGARQVSSWAHPDLEIFQNVTLPPHGNSAASVATYVTMTIGAAMLAYF